MAYMRFLKENEPSQKQHYKPFTKKMKKWKLLCLLEGLVIIGLLIKLYY